MSAQNLAALAALPGGITAAWIQRQLRYSPVAPKRVKILAVFIVGSVARNTATGNSDIDVAVVIPPVCGKTALQVTEAWHARFKGDRFEPRWQGRVLDIQFFYPDDPELAEYTKVPLPDRQA